MNKNSSFYKQEVIDGLLRNSYEFRQMSNELSDSALRNARERLHPLLQRGDLEKLGRRHDFLEAFKCSLEREIAKKSFCGYRVSKLFTGSMLHGEAARRNGIIRFIYWYWFPGSCLR